MSVINKCNYKTFTKSLPRPLLHCIKTFWSIHWEVPGNGYFEVRKVNWPLYNIYSLVSPQQQRNYQLEKMMISIPLGFHLIQAFGTAKCFVHFLPK